MHLYMKNSNQLIDISIGEANIYSAMFCINKDISQKEKKPDSKKKGSFLAFRKRKSNIGNNSSMIYVTNYFKTFIDLIYKKTRNKNAKQSLTIATVNILRQRIEIPDMLTTNFKLTHKNEIFESIAHSRKAVLVFEYHDHNAIGSWRLAEQELFSVGYTTRKRYYPVPQQELNSNPNLTQNLGY